MQIRHTVRLEPEDYSLGEFIRAVWQLVESGVLPADAHLIFGGSSGGADEAGKRPSGIRYLSVSWTLDA